MDHEETRLGLGDVLSAEDVAPLLAPLVQAGATHVIVTDTHGRVLWTAGDPPKDPGGSGGSIPLAHAGEPIGWIQVGSFSAPSPGRPAVLLSIASAALEAVIRSGVERLRSNHVQASTIRRSQEQLEQANRQLLAAHHKCEDLAGTLHQRVDERTAELNRAHTKLLQREKATSIGQLAAGVAHEMNTPLHYVSGNIRVLSSYIDDLHATLQGYRDELRRLSLPEEQLERTDEAYRKVDVPYIVSDARELVSESLQGTERMGRIVATLKGFSHVDDAACRIMDFNVELDRTLDVLACTERGHAAKIVRQYESLPGFYGNPALMSQALLNVLSNALQSRDHGLVVVAQTAARGQEIVVSIADNGQGIPQEIRHRIFDPFFTTRGVGQGSGMGLAVAYDVVVSHGGTIAVDTEVGRGTRMDIILPLGGQP